jgi:hypothetical protein
VAKIFKEAIENGLILPISKRPAEIEKYSDSNYCPYHQVLGHPIEDCWVFKDWVEKGYTEGIIKFPQNVLQSSAPYEAKEQEESVQFRVCTISHYMINEDSDEGIVFNLKSIKTHFPESESKKKKSQKESGVIKTLSRSLKKRGILKKCIARIMY